MTLAALDSTTTDLAEELAAVAQRLRGCTVQVRSRRWGAGRV
jgi:hypothetical protein